MKTRAERTLFTIFAICVGAGILLLRMSRDFGDGDYLWHTSLYDYIIAHRALPVEDNFSWVSAEHGYTEIAHSWLGSVILGAFVRLFTERGCAPLFGGRMFALFFYTVCVLVTRHTFFKGRLSWAYLPTCCIFATMFANVRIQCISATIFVCAVYVLLRSGEEGASAKHLALLPVLTFLCANIHGGTVVLLLGIMLVYTVWQFIPAFEAGRLYHAPAEDKALRFKYLIAVVVSAICAMINPYGLRLYTYFMHVGNSEFSRSFVSEWQPATSAQTHFRILAVLMLLMLTVNKRVNILHLGLVLGFLLLSFKHCRFLAYGVMCSVPLIQEYISGWKESALYGRIMDRFGSILAILVAVVGAGVIVLGWVVVTNFVEERDTPQTWRELDADLVEYLSEKSFERPYCTYNVGGSLIYYGFQSFVDSRADLFTGDELMDCSYIGNLKKERDELDELVSKYNFDAFILNKAETRGLRYYLELRGWVEDYTDENFAVYVRGEE